jgi:tetratricopeptide (TPR) repeat protein
MDTGTMLREQYPSQLRFKEGFTMNLSRTWRLWLLLVVPILATVALAATPAKTPDTFQSHLEKGNELLLAGNLDDARTEYERAVELDPKSPIGYNNLGIVYRRQKLDFLAIGQFKRALEIEPRYYKAANNMGNCFYSTGEYEEAIKNYKDALKIRPSFAEAYYNLALCYEKQGKNPEAMDSWRKFLKLQAGGENVDIAEDHLAQLMSGKNPEGMQSPKPQETPGTTPEPSPEPTPAPAPEGTQPQ